MNLEKKVQQIKRECLELCIHAGAGHVTSAFSCAEIMTLLYYVIWLKILLAWKVWVEFLGVYRKRLKAYCHDSSRNLISQALQKSEDLLTRPAFFGTVSSVFNPCNASVGPFSSRAESSLLGRELLKVS